MSRIVCVGNAFHEADAAGAAVLERLRRRKLPPGVELVDGGIAGLDLLPHFEGTDRVVLVDGSSGLGAPGAVLVLDGRQVAALHDGGYDHGAGIPYLLSVLPRVAPGATASVTLVALEPPATPASLNLAARLALSLAAGATAALPCR